MSNDIQSQITAKIHSFAGELEALVRRAALDAVAEALGSNGAKSPRASAPHKTATAVAAPAKAGKRGRRVRRSPEALGAAADDIYKHIKVHAGQRSEQVRAALGIDKKTWIPAIKKLMEDKKIVSKGQKRATTYSAK